MVAASGVTVTSNTTSHAALGSSTVRCSHAAPGTLIAVAGGEAKPPEEVTPPADAAGCGVLKAKGPAPLLDGANDNEKARGVAVRGRRPAVHTTSMKKESKKSSS